MTMHPMLSTYLDGLDASGDGRGFNGEHAKARVFVERACEAATINLEMLAALKAAQFALNSVRNTSLKHPDFRNTYDVAAFVDRAVARGEEYALEA